MLRLYSIAQKSSITGGIYKKEDRPLNFFREYNFQIKAQLTNQKKILLQISMHHSTLV